MSPIFRQSASRLRARSRFQAGNGVKLPDGRTGVIRLVQTNLHYTIIPTGSDFPVCEHENDLLPEPALDLLATNEHDASRWAGGDRRRA